MATKHVIQIEVTSNSDDAAVRQFEASLQRLGATSAKAQGGMASLAGTIKNALGGAIAGVVGMGAFIKFLHDGMTAAIAEERTLRVLSDTARRFGQDGQEAADAAKALGDTLQQVGFDDDEIVKGVQQLLSVTRDYRTAVSAAGLAADVAAKQNIPYAEALGLISDMLAGRERGLVYKLAELGISATTAQDGLFKLDGAFRGYASTVNDTQANVGAAKAEFDDLGKSLGSTLAPVLVHVLKVLQVMVQYWAVLGNVVYTAAISLRTAGQVLGNLAMGHGEAALGNIRAFGNEVSARWSEWAADLRAIWVEAGKAAGDYERLGRKALAASHKTGDEGEASRDEYIKAAQEREKRATEALQKAIDERKSLIRGFYAWQRDETRRRQDEEDAERRTQAAKQAAANAKANQDLQDRERLWTDIERENAQARITLAQAERDAKLDAQMQALGAVANYSAAAQALFGKNKAVAVATAMIDTWVGAQSAFAQTPGPIWVKVAAAVAAVAMGLARVQQIKSMSVGRGAGAGSGGGIPSTASPVVYQGGRGQGAGAGSVQSMTTINTTRHEGAQVVNVNALTGAQAAAALNEFERMRRPAGRAVDRAYATRGATKAGTAR